MSRDVELIKADRRFWEKLNGIKAERIKAGDRNNSLRSITADILDCPSFEQLEKELLRKKGGSFFRKDAKRLY